MGLGASGDMPAGIPWTGSFAGADSASFIACAWQMIACLEVQGGPMEPQGGQARRWVLW